MKQHLLLLVGLFFSTLAFAQQSISGTVTDELGEPVIGATVVVTGTSTGTATDFDGKWELTVPDGSESITVSYIGYDKQRILLDGRNVLEVQLSEGVALSEVVVTGYSVSTAREATGAISTISTDRLTAIPSGNVEQQLQGRASGVTVISNGQPGTDSKVRIRGFGSFNNNQPLYVVDGIPLNSVNFLPAEDIESTTILKDAASASIYGARAAGGVIVYTTKKGSRDGGIKVSYDGLVGFTTAGSGADILNPQQQAEVILQGRQNDLFLAGEDPNQPITHPVYDFSDPNNVRIPDFLQIGAAGTSRFGQPTQDELDQFSIDPDAGLFLIQPANIAGTDWYDEITRTATVTRHSLGFSGGADKGRYYFGFNYQDQEGVLINNDFTRYVVRGNSEFDLLPTLRVGSNIQFQFIENLGQIGGGGGQNVANEETDVLLAFRNAPILPARIGPNLEGYGGTAAGGANFGNAANPLANRESASDNTNNNLGVVGSVYAELDIVKGLYAKTLYGGNYFTFQGRGFGRRTYERSENILNNTYSEFSGAGGSYVWTNTLNFDYTIADQHDIKGLVGFEANRLDNFNVSNSSGINPFNFTPSFASLSNVTSPNVTSFFGTQRTFVSQFGQVNYNFDEKYYFTGVLRRDASSAFGENNRSAFFPAVSAAWRVTGEDFLAPTSTLSDLKIRGGVGRIGNANAVSVINQFDLFSGSIFNTAYAIDGSQTSAIQGFAQSQIGNPNAQWEESNTINIGAEATMFNDKFEIILDLWRKRNEGVLFPVALPNVNGAANAPFVNVATVNNKGIDVLLTYRDRRGKFNWQADLTGSFLDNEILEIAEGIDFFESAGFSRLEGNIVRNEVGQSISTFFGYQVEGLWQSFDEVDAAGGDDFQLGAAPGRFRFADINGTDDEGNIVPGADGQITAADRTQIGSPVPDFTGGLNIKVGFGDFDLETFLYASIGNEVFNFSRWYTDFLVSFTEGSAKSTRLLDAWSPTNTGSSIPIVESGSNFSTNTQVNSYYVEDAGYLRMRNLSLGYNVPASVLGDKISRARVFVNANNLFTITGYEGLDPSVGGSDDTNFGIDVGNYPITRSYQLGVSLGF